MTDGQHGSKNIVLITLSPAAVRVAARGAKQSGCTGWSASDGSIGRCAGGTLVKSREISQDSLGKWL